MPAAVTRKQCFMSKNILLRPCNFLHFIHCSIAQCLKVSKKVSFFNEESFCFTLEYVQMIGRFGAKFQMLYLKKLLNRQNP